MSRTQVGKPAAPVVRLARMILLPLLRRRYRLRAIDLAGLDRLEPPYVVVANHTNFWDPFWINTWIPAPIQFVTSDNIFRTPLMRLAMRLTGSIPKSKLMRDTSSVAEIFRTVRRGGVVGIFPEGARTYDGRSTEPLYPVARLISKLSVPVISVTIKGGYLAKPRWARSVRHGEVWLEYRMLFSSGDLPVRNVATVYHRLTEALSWDEMEEQRTRMVRFRSANRAEYLERMLFLCPQCGRMSTLHSTESLLVCTSCGYIVHLDEFGFLRARSGQLYFDTPSAWNSWQQATLRRMAEDGSVERNLPLTESNVILWKGRRTEPLRRSQPWRGMCAARLDRDGIELLCPRGGGRLFPLAEIEGMNVQNGEKLEFYCNGVLYRLDFTNRRSSSYLWERMTAALRAGGAAPRPKSPSPDSSTLRSSAAPS